MTSVLDILPPDCAITSTAHGLSVPISFSAGAITSSDFCSEDSVEATFVLLRRFAAF